MTGDEDVGCMKMTLQIDEIDKIVEMMIID
jgi:hypothetical protein